MWLLSLPVYSDYVRPTTVAEAQIRGRLEVRICFVLHLYIRSVHNLGIVVLLLARGSRARWVWAVPLTLLKGQRGIVDNVLHARSWAVLLAGSACSPPTTRPTGPLRML
eukprot:COSAG05_NODE_3586_length_1974_cov_6.681600_1_plen_109_part_00